MMNMVQRQKTLTVRLDDESHKILEDLARVRGQNKTQVLKRMLREERVREELLKDAQPKAQPNYQDWNEAKPK